VLRPDLPTYRIGDSERPRDMLSATQDAADAVELIGLHAAFDAERARTGGGSR
jgi:hypothetical protein